MWTDLLWASERWHMARSIHIEVTDDVVKWLPAAFAKNPWTPGWLTELQLVDGNPDNYWHHLALEAIGSLLEYAPNLTLLACRTYAGNVLHLMCCMPMMWQLQHLILVLELNFRIVWRPQGPIVDIDDLKERLMCGLELLVQMPALKTLHLKHLAYSCSASSKRAVAMRMPLLDLMPPPEFATLFAGLQHVRLENYIVGGMKMPGGCVASASFTSGRADFVQDAQWQEMLPQLRCIELCDSVWDGCCKQTSRVMDLLRCCTLLRDLRLDLQNSTGSQHIFPLDGSLARLQTLSVTARDMSVFLPSCARMQCLRLWCSGQLNVNFEDVGVFVQHANAFVFAQAVQHMQQSTSMENLRCALADKGVPWSISSFLGAPGMHAIHSKHYSADTVCYGPACMCGACMRCLRRQGRLAGQWDLDCACMHGDVDSDALHTLMDPDDWPTVVFR